MSDYYNEDKPLPDDPRLPPEERTKRAMVRFKRKVENLRGDMVLIDGKYRLPPEDVE